MGNLAKQYELTIIFAFQQRVRAAAVQAAILISGEDDNPEHAKSQCRQAYAWRVIQGQVNFDAIVWAVAANASILITYMAGDEDESVIPDGDIEYTMATIWDDLSGAALIAPPVEIIPEP